MISLYLSFFTYPFPCSCLLLSFICSSYSSFLILSFFSLIYSFKISSFYFFSWCSAFLSYLSTCSSYSTFFLSSPSSLFFYLSFFLSGLPSILLHFYYLSILNLHISTLLCRKGKMFWFIPWIFYFSSFSSLYSLVLVFAFIPPAFLSLIPPILLFISLCICFILFIWSFTFLLILFILSQKRDKETR